MAKRPSKSDTSPVIENRRARYDYHILDTLECGIILTGTEVKSLRNGQASLEEGFVRV
jgi:SsrA-binding protein